MISLFSKALQAFEKLTFRKERERRRAYLAYLCTHAHQKSNEKLALDFGCGEKGRLATLHQTFSLVVGLDVDKRALNKAKNLRLKNVDFILADCLHAPLKSDIFDVVTCTHVLEHLTNPSDGLNEIKRVLKEQANCFIEVPCLADLFGSTFSKIPMIQGLRALFLRAIGNIYYERKSLFLTKLFFKVEKQHVKLRWFFPTKYFADTLSQTVDLNDYVNAQLEGRNIGLAHKHWFLRGEWTKIVEDSGLKILANEGLWFVYILTMKNQKKTFYVKSIIS